MEYQVPQLDGFCAAAGCLSSVDDAELSPGHTGGLPYACAVCSMPVPGYLHLQHQPSWVAITIWWGASPWNRTNTIECSTRRPCYSGKSGDCVLAQAIEHLFLLNRVKLKIVKQFLSSIINSMNEFSNAHVDVLLVFFLAAVLLNVLLHDPASVHARAQLA